jgi:CRISPR-associated exonuclease Cas4
MRQTEYAADDLLALSGIQHFSFCRRQWALIHIERLWQENALTAEGRLMHNRSDNPFQTLVRDGIITAHAMPVASYRLGLFGVCDVVEFIPSEKGIPLRNRPGLYRPQLVEYKRGKEKEDESDMLQVCAQALCLEEMIPVDIPFGYLFYGETRRRVEVAFSEKLRAAVEDMADEMHAYFARGYTPRVKTSKACKSCSLSDQCLPRLQTRLAASNYIRQQIGEEHP